MKWGSSLSRLTELDAALDECVASLDLQLGAAGDADLAAVFASPLYHRDSHPLAAAVRARFPRATVVGCSGAGVIGSGHEEEDAPALSITAGVLPGVALRGFHLGRADLPSPDAPPQEWAAVVGVSPGDAPHFIVLADPFTMDGEALLAGLDYAYPEAAKIGGLASGGSQLTPHSLILDDAVHREGAVGVALSGNIVVDTVVAQGCRPIGDPMRVTEAEHNLIMSVDGERPLDRLQHLYERLHERDRRLVHRNLFMGVAMDPLLEKPSAGDFLIRNVMGVDPRGGAVAIGALIREGQIVQFHVRDAETSAEDLRRSLADYVQSAGGSAAAGALLFSCTGRGRYLYGEPDHDTGIFGEMVGGLPLGGFFCNGEIGPVAGTTYLHGYTSSFALFRPRTATGGE